MAQIWAEALDLYRHGEKLYLNSTEEAITREEQTQAMETDDREGLVRAYLDTPLPANWDDLPLYDRRAFLNDDFRTEGVAAGTKRRTVVCNMAIWCECFGKTPESMKRADSYEISAIMEKMDGWEKSGSQRLSIYGLQRVYVLKQAKQE